MEKIDERDIGSLKERAISIKVKTEAIVDEKKVIKKEMKKLGLKNLKDFDKEIARLDKKKSSVLSKTKKQMAEADAELTKAEKAIS